MYRRAFARHRTGAALLLGLSLRAPSASAEPAETRVGTVEGKTAQELPSAAETPPIPAAPIVAPRLIRDERVAYPEQASGERFYERVELRSSLELDASGRVRSSSVETPPGHVNLDGYPARFGRFAGGVVSAQTLGPEPAPSGEARLRLFDVGGLIETPFARGRGSLLRSLLFLLSPEVKLDYQARATHEPSARDRFSAFGFGSHDLRGEKRYGILGRLGDACRPKITFTW
jgi:hypothetical protein